MTGRWHTDKRIGEIIILPNGTRVRIASIRGSKVRLEYIDPRREPQVGGAVPAPVSPTSSPTAPRRDAAGGSS